MLVCNCNGLNEHAVRQAIAAGARNAAEIYAHHGCQMGCGKCADELTAYLLSHQLLPINTPAFLPAAA